MQRPGPPPRFPSGAARNRQTRLSSLTLPKDASDGARQPRRSSVSGLAPGQKVQRTSKTSQKLVVLPSAPQTKPLQPEEDDEPTFGYETDAGIREYKSEAERMSKEQRKKAGFKRITAYCIAETFRLKHLSSYLTREHNVTPRAYDEALYVMYHLPLLPGYGPNSNIRSSAPPPKREGRISTRLSEAEENGYQDSYFTSIPVESPPSHTFVTPDESPRTEFPTSSDEETDDATATPRARRSPAPPAQSPEESRQHHDTEHLDADDIGEVIFFEYGVAVFFGLSEEQERGILDDIDNAGVLRRKVPEPDWEVEECHYTQDPQIPFPRIYNDFFTLKSHSHLLKLSIAHAFAQSTLLARFETVAQRVLSSPQTLSIPKQLAMSGKLKMKRHEALRLTGRLFRLRRDVNLVSNVLDVPELFWSEASLKELYDAVREYMEIGPRVQVINEKLVVASDFLDAIHDHLNNSAMDRITWIVIWLIVVAILVDLGEVVARLIFHATMDDKSVAPLTILNGTVMSQEDVLQTLYRMMEQS
ncbi:hypothetical protein BD626DRAFT_402162 [Schizophyllum amplum]|uniref:DUF155 domain-containing protein n=1 Tax=Schizophyllum amplum TaxID=97359 RepID=A0A550CFM6_9AGAR|nr:hypothetical protein BD626DRAFT_402162 [Auriculariopsis ampla]